MAIFVYPNSLGMPWEDREMDHIMLDFDDFLRQHRHPLLLRTQQQNNKQQQQQQQHQEEKQEQKEETSRGKTDSCESSPSDQKSCCEEKENKSPEKKSTNGPSRHRNYTSLTDQILNEFIQFYQGRENLQKNQSLNRNDRQACSFCSSDQKSTTEDKGNQHLEKKSGNAPSRQNNKRNRTERMFDDFLQLYHDRANPRGNIYLWNEGDLFPVRESTNSPFEVTLNLRDCDPDKIQVEVKDGLLKVEGRKESEDGSFVYVKHERTIPKGVSPSSLKASLLPQGILREIGQKGEEGKVLPITVEKDSNQPETTKKEQIEQKTENEDKQEEKRTQ